MLFFSISLGILGITFFLLHGIYVHKLGTYLKDYHPSKWQDLSPQKFLWIPRDSLETRNYFTEMSFVFSPDNLKDEKVLHLKKRIKLFLFLSIIFLVSIFLSLFG